MVNRRAAIALILILCMGGANPAGGQPVAAAPGGPTPIDLVVLIDQSGSMWGHPVWHPGKNDPWNHRIGATKHIVFRFMQHAADNHVAHRISVIDFADEAKVALSNQTISDPAQFNKLRASLETSVKPQDWLNTNTAAALDAAQAEVAKMDAAPLPGPRRRIVLLLTDGRPLMPGVPDSVLRQRIRQDVAALSRSGVEFWVVGLNDADDYWNSSEGAFWEELTGKGRARLAESASAALPSIFQGVVDEWLGLTSTIVRGDQYDAPPYLRRIVFTVSFGRPRGDVKIVDPDGHVVPRTGGGPPVAPATFALYAIDDPKPGVYNIVRDPTRADVVHAEEFSPAVERLEPRGEADAKVDGAIVFQARRADKSPLKLLPEYPVNASIVITDSLGNQTTLSAKAEDDGRFSTTWKPPKPGRYRVVLRGLIRRKDGTEYDIFANSGNSYSKMLDVGNRQPYALRIVEPDPARGLRAVPWKQSADVRLQLLNPDGTPLTNFKGIVVDPDTWLSIQSADPSGTALGPIIPLRSAGGGAFVARIPTSVQWSKGEGLRTAGKFQFRVFNQPGHFLGERYLRSIELPSGLQDRRLGRDPLTAGPFNVWLVWWGWLILGAIVVAFVGMFLWLVLARWLPGYLIRKEDRDARRIVRIKVYDESRDPLGNASEGFNVTGKRVADLNVVLDGDPPQIAQRFRFTRSVGDRRPRGTLRYKWKNSKQPHTAELSSGNVRTLDGTASGSEVVLLMEEANQ